MRDAFFIPGAMSLYPEHPRAVILSGQGVRADIKSARVGVYDEIREDIREFSTVQPVDQVLIERIESGWQGLLHSGRDAFIFCFDSSGFAAKPVNASETKVMQYGFRLLDGERELTGAVREREAVAEQEAINEVNATPSTPFIATFGVGESALKRVKGPKRDHVNRDILLHQVTVDTIAVSPEENLAAGGVITNDKGQLLIVKPTGGYGGYDWTFPKGGLETEEYDRFGVDGLETAAKREILEETGCVVETERFIAKINHQDGGTCYYFAMKLIEELPKNADATDGEIAERKWVTTMEAMELLHENDDIKVLSLATQKVPKLLIKALPKQSKATKDAKSKKQGATPIKAGAKKAGKGGKTRYDYPSEKGAPKKKAPAAAPAGGGQAAAGEEQPPTEMDPITVPKDGAHAEPPKHTVDLAPLFQLTDMDRDKWAAVAQRFQKDGMGKRHGFMRYMQTHLKEFATKYNLDGDYFGLVYDVLTGANPGVKPTTSQNQ